MRKLLNVAFNDVRVTFTDKSVWLQLVVIPVVIMFFIGLANGGIGSPAPVKIRVDVFDQDRSALSQQLLADFQAATNNMLILCPQDTGADDTCRLKGAELTETLAAERVKNSTVQATIVIPAGFGAGALAGEPVKVVYQSQETPGQTSATFSALQSAVGRISSATLAAQVADNATSGLEFADDMAHAEFKQAAYNAASETLNALPPTVTYAESAAKEGRQPSGLSQSVPGIGTMYVMSTTIAIMFVLLQERKQWTFQRILSMPVAPWEFVGGKLLGRIINGLIQYGVAFGFGIIMGTYFGESPLAIAVLAVAFTLCSTALGLLLATVVKSEMQAASLINLVVLIAAPLGGAWWPLEIVPEWMRTVGHLSPISWVMDGFRNVIYYGGGLESVLPSVLVLLGMTVVLFGLAVTRLKYE